jgi:hypothetical protein
MFIVKDQLCNGTKWHIRTNPANPALDPYFPIGQAALELAVKSGHLIVTLKTLTPNFRSYEVQFDTAAWTPSTDRFPWTLHLGTNRLAARTVNEFGVLGPVSIAEIQLTGLNN